MTPDAASLSTELPPPRPAVTGVIGGLVLMAVFTALWSSLSISAWPGPRAWSITAVGALTAVVFLGGAVRLARSLQHFPSMESAPDHARGRRVGIAFGCVFATEGLLIGVTSAVLQARGLGDYEIPAVALIVGLHFAPMARIFDRTIDYYVSAWLSAVAIVGIIAVGRSWAAVPHVWGCVGIGAALSTMTYGVFMLHVTNDLLHRLPTQARPL
jgi:hypothetical protein